MCCRTCTPSRDPTLSSPHHPVHTQTILPLQEARFDRHFVRDLQWSRHQLEELAERRFMAAQMEQQRRKGLLGGPHATAAGNGEQGGEAAAAPKLYSFAELFNAIKVEDFSSYISKVGGAEGVLWRTLPGQGSVAPWRAPIPPTHPPTHRPPLQLSTPRELMLFMTGEAPHPRICCARAGHCVHASACPCRSVALAPQRPCPPALAPCRLPPAELLARIEAHPDNQLSAQDMEIAVSKALEQAV